MKAQYGILRFKKYKGPAISPIEAHNERTKEQYASNPDIDTSKSKDNFHIIRPHDSRRPLPCPQGQCASGGSSCHRQPGVFQG